MNNKVTQSMLTTDETQQLVLSIAREPEAQFAEFRLCMRSGAMPVTMSNSYVTDA